MERESRKNYQTRGSARGGSGGGTTSERDLLLQWGNRKRLRCVKVQRRDVEAAATVTAEKAAAGQRRAAAVAAVAAATAAGQHHPTGHAHAHHRGLRNSEEPGAMRPPSQQQQHQQNSTIRTVASPGRERSGKGHNDNNGVQPTSLDEKKGSSSGSEGSIWPNFAVALTNKEKEEDFLVFKGSKLPQRPKKRVKAIQRTVNFVCPGTWLCDLTLERYEVREKKVSKKRPRGLKAMHDMDSESE
ncbi:hypothetical protein ACQ4PT_049038 [Festuca glaucescens]